MANVIGDWFHSRTGSQLSELAAIQLLVESSNRLEYFGKNWGADRNNPENTWLYDFSATAKLQPNESIQPSTMQTKIRQWIRLGFIEDDNTLPLRWTQLGKLWADSVNEGRGSDANLLYNLIIANSIGIISFSEDQKRPLPIPKNDGLAIKTLINDYTDENGFVSDETLSFLVDGNTERVVSKNFSYWKTDIINSSLFIKHNKVDDEGNIESGLKINNQRRDLVKAISEYEPASESTMQSIRNNPLAQGAPFREGLIEEFKKDGSEELLEAINSLSRAPLIRYHRGTGTRLSYSTQPTQSNRSQRWSNDIKRSYHYQCAVPGCDAEGKLFIQAAHIKPFSAKEEDIPLAERENHQNDLHNGMALCLSCHKLFDAGLFTINHDNTIKLSNFIYSSNLISTTDQTNINRLLLSDKEELEMPSEVEISPTYTLYHREHIYLGED